MKRTFFFSGNFAFKKKKHSWKEREKRGEKNSFHFGVVTKFLEKNV